MGECILTPVFGDFGDRKAIIDIAPPFVRLEEAQESDPGSVVNSGPGFPAMAPEITK